jgi:F0F1-type ATP synthase membrane subunit b/b'
MRALGLTIFTTMIFVSMIATAWAVGGGAAGEHHASPKELIFPAINVTILLVLLFWKLKQPAIDYFTNNAIDVEKQFDQAAAKGKEAQHRMELYQGKMDSIGDKRKMVRQEEDEEIVRFTRKVKEEREHLISRMKSDTDSRIDSDRINMEQEMQRELVDSVIIKTKGAITFDLAKQSKASKKLISKLV